MKLDLHNHMILVVNGRGKLGEAITDKLVCAGANAIIADRDGDSYVLRAISEESQIRVQGISELFKEILNRFGKIDALINNIEPWFCDIGRNDAKLDWQDQLRRAMDFCRCCGEIMKKYSIGSIVTIISAAGTVAMKSEAEFCTVSAGLQSFTKELALELGDHNIRVNAVSFGAIEKLGAGFEHVDRLSERMLSHVPQGRFGTCGEVADSSLFLCAKESDYITGQVLTVDGGWCCGYHRDF